MLARRAVKHRKGRGNERVGQLSPEAVIIFSNICEMIWMMRPLPHLKILTKVADSEASAPPPILHSPYIFREGAGQGLLGSDQGREGGRGRGPVLLSISPGYIEKQCLVVRL